MKFKMRSRALVFDVIKNEWAVVLRVTKSKLELSYHGSKGVKIQPREYQNNMEVWG